MMHHHQKPWLRWKLPLQAMSPWQLIRVCVAMVILHGTLLTLYQAGGEAGDWL